MQVSLKDMQSAVAKMHSQINISTDVLEKCTAMCAKSSMEAIDFLNCVEAFLINQSTESMNFELLPKLESYVLKEANNRNKKVVTPASTQLKPSQASGDTVLGKRPNKAIHVTPSSDRKNPSTENTSTQKTALESSFSQAVGVSYHQRTSKDQKALDYNLNLGMRGSFEPSDVKPLGTRCKVLCNDDDFYNVGQRYRYMFTSLDERARALDRHLLNIQEQICEMANIPTTSLQPVGVPSQDNVWVCGRICCEAAEGRINKTSIILEGSRRDSAGRRVNLELQDVSSYSLFPGQIVMVEGMNSSGRKMIAKRIIEGLPLPTPKTPANKLLEYHHSTYYQGSKPLSIITAAGPFTTSDNLDYEPFEDLLKHVLKKKPDVLILNGPFVDIKHPILATGDATVKRYDDEGNETEHLASYEMVFAEKIMRDGLSALFNSEEDHGTIPTQIILVPSLLDAHHEFVFPQPPFGDRDRVQTEFFEEDLGILDVPYSRDDDPRKRVHLMPNPCMFRVNEVLFGVCSNDNLFSLSSDEVSQNIEGQRLQRLAAHMLQQQSFCPQFPVPTSSLSQLDLRQASHWEFQNASPDILIIPSRLTVLAKETMGTLVINPGQLTKGKGGGTYAELAIHPISENDIRDASIASATGSDKSGIAGSGPSVPMSNGIGKRTSVIISKI